MKVSTRITPRLEIDVIANEHRGSSSDYRFSAEAAEFPGCLSFGATKAEAMRRCQAVVLRLLAEEMCRPDAPPLRELAFHLTESTEGPPAKRGHDEESALPGITSCAGAPAATPRPRRS